MAEPQHRTRILAEKQFTGIRVDLCEYDWDPGAEIISLESEIVLKLRLEPDRLQAFGRIDGRAVPSLGPMLVRQPNELNRSQGADVPEKALVINCRFAPDWVRSIFGIEHMRAASMPFHNVALHNTELTRIMRRMAAEVSACNLGRDVMIQSLANSAAVDLFRHFHDEAERRKAGHEDMATTKRLRHIRELVEETRDVPPTCSMIAKELRIGEHHLRRFFKQATGQPLRSYIEDVRIERAQELLRDTCLPLKAISYKLGFKQPSGFSSTLRRVTGESPLQYRHRSDPARGSFH